jgi:nicotinamidase-related amidase
VTIMRTNCEQNQFYAFDPAHTALVCIDYQMDFLSDQGLCAERGLPVGALQRVIAPSARVLTCARAAGIRIVHTRECYAPDLSDLNPFRKGRDTIIGAPGPLGRFLIRGEPGTLNIEQMAPLADETVIDKAGFSAFFRTPLESILQRNAVTHLVLMGVTTQCCVSSTLRATVDHGYFPLVLQDCCAAWDPSDHEASLRVIYPENHQFGWVSDSTRFLESLDGISTNQIR